MILGFASTASAQSMLECSRLESEQERLDCYDRVAGRVEEKLEEQRVGTTEKRVEARNEAITEEVVGKQPDTAVPDILTVEIEKVLRDRNRRPVYRTTDGRLFRPSSSSRITFEAGERCVIEEGAFGSMFLVSEDGKRNKVKELNVE